MKSMDIRSLKMPDVLVKALVTLVARVCGKSQDDCDLLLGAVLGKGPSFGNLAQVAAVDIENKAQQAQVIGLSAVAIHEIINLFAHINEHTTVCLNCGEMGLSASGGTVQEYPSGTACPFCRAGTFERVPMTLRRVHWVTGVLTDAGVGEDVTTFPATFVPHDDVSLKRWVGNVHPSLLNACAQAQIPLYGLLAVMNLRRREFRNVGHDGKTFLQDPDEFGIMDDSLSLLVEEAQRFLDERELTNLPERKFLPNGMRRSDYWPLKIGTRTYLVEGLIGQGDKCDVYRGWWDDLTTERVVIKVLVERKDRDLFEREARMLLSFDRFQDVDSEFFRTFIPKLVEVGRALFPDGTVHQAVIYRYSHQYDWTLSAVAWAYPRGIPPRAAVWMFNRMSELLAWLHGKRIVHGAVLPPHWLVKCENHRMKLVDWGYADQPGSLLQAHCAAWKDFYPEEFLASGRLLPIYDVQMMCRCVLNLLGASPATGQGASAHCPEGKDVSVLIKMLYDHAGYAGSRPVFRETIALSQAFKSAAKSVYGPPSYQVFRMPNPLMVRE